MTDRPPSTNPTERFRLEVRSILAALGPSLEKRTEALRNLQGALREEAAAALTEPLNTAVAQMPAATYEEKKIVATWVNEQLREYGLAVKCPRSGLPGILQANPGNDPARGRFRIEVLDAKGQRQHHMTAVRLPELSLVVDTTPRIPHRVRREWTR